MMNMKEEGRSSKVTASHRPPPGEPIVLKKGDLVEVGREFTEDPEWPDWIECTSEDNRKSWVPKQFIEQTGKKGRAICDYSAKELSVDPGEMLRVIKSLNGWAWAENAAGETGWLPIRNIEPC